MKARALKFKLLLVSAVFSCSVSAEFLGGGLEMMNSLQEQGSLQRLEVSEVSARMKAWAFETYYGTIVPTGSILDIQGNKKIFAIDILGKQSIQTERAEIPTGEISYVYIIGDQTGPDMGRFWVDGSIPKEEDE